MTCLALEYECTEVQDDYGNIFVILYGDEYDFFLKNKEMFKKIKFKISCCGGRDSENSVAKLVRVKKMDAKNYQALKFCENTNLYNKISDMVYENVYEKKENRDDTTDDED